MVGSKFFYSFKHFEMLLNECKFYIFKNPKERLFQINKLMLVSDPYLNCSHSGDALFPGILAS